MRPVGNQASFFDVFPLTENCRQAASSPKAMILFRFRVNERISTNVKSLCSPVDRYHSGRNILRSLDYKRQDLKSKRATRRFYFVHFTHGTSSATVCNDRQPAEMNRPGNPGGYLV